MVVSGAALYTLTFTVVLLFLMFVTVMLFAISMLRQMQLRAQEERLALNYHLDGAVIRRHLHLVSSPLERMTPWHVITTDDSATGLPRYTSAQLTPGPVITPLRPQESLLYADTLTPQPAAPQKTPEYSLTA